MKNIPIAGIKEVRIQNMQSVNVFMNSAKWRAGFALNPDWKGDNKETYGFRSTAAPPQIKELEELQDKLADMVVNLKFKEAPIRNKLQDKLRKEIKEINKDKKVFVKADKTSNYYKVEVDSYENLLHDNITKDYRKTDEAKVDAIKDEATKIATRLELEDRIFKTSKREATITLKDHKALFRENPTCRLINPTKPEMGRASKRILSKVITEVKKRTQYHQWKSTNATTKWFQEKSSEQPNRSKLNFIQCDIEAFYPSISQELLNNALNWATTYTTITEEEREIILHSKRSVLYFKGTPWVKQEDPDFDIGMGAFDGAECCDLVGLYLLSQMQHLNIAIGLYRDDCLAISSLTKRQNQLVLQELHRIFNRNGLKIPGAEANRRVVDYLNVTMDLSTGSFKTFAKEGDTLAYVDSRSNHPPSITRNLPKGINRLLSDTNSSQELFEASAPPYQAALDAAGYNHKLSYQPRVEEEQVGVRRRNRQRRITWFNPAFSQNCTTNIPKVFLSIIAECFPPGHVLRSSFNANTVKVSYRTMTNMAQHLSKHNAKVIAESRPAPTVKEGCNCQDKPACPMPGKCQTSGVVYKATVTPTDPTSNKATETYTGLTGGPFRTRHYGHVDDMKEENQDKPGTTLSKHTHKLRREGIDFTITWDILERRLAGYNTSSKSCRLCLLEKYHIMFTPGVATLNRRRELFSSCRHRRKLTLGGKKAKP